MSRFYVGQRVRKVGGSWNLGAVATVAELDPSDPFGMTVGIVMGFVARGETDAGELKWAMPGEVGFCYPSDLEPLQDADAGSWEAIEALLPGIRAGVSA